MCQCVLAVVLTLCLCFTRILCVSSSWTDPSQEDFLSHNRYIISPDHLHSYQNQGVKQRDMKGLVGEPIQLPCSVNREACGELHSIKWYRGSSRIYVFSELASIARAEGDYADRALLHPPRNGNISYLQIKELQVSDEAVYKCEITYLEVRENCQVVQFINLITLIKPSSVKLFRTSFASGNEIQNASKVGPLSEDDELRLICETEGGKPTPSVEWWNGSSQIQGEPGLEVQSSVTYARKNIKVIISRGDLGARYECRVNNDALASPLVSYVDLDVNVRPLSLNLSGVEHHVVEGSNVMLQCLVKGARPAANITWYNGTQLIPSNEHEKTIQTDGTFDTMSTLTFKASRYENGGSLTCESTNDVMLSRNEAPMRDNIKLEVMYRPIVTVYPENITVNESMNVTILCHYEANPSTLLSIKWLRNGQVVKSSSGSARAASDEDAVDETVFTVQDATHEKHHGIYTCTLKNEVGDGSSSNAANVSVYYKPQVNLITDPPTPVREIDNENVTLLCQVHNGYPDTLLAVRWFLDGELLKELPDCSSTNATLCDVDPSKLLLEEVERRFHGNYSCAGMNEAGWGPVSTPTAVIVHYPPGITSLAYYPLEVKKKGSVTLKCSVKDEGRPPGPIYRWSRGAHTILDVTTANWTIDPVTLETEANFSCVAVNAGGESVPAYVALKVLAPPNFIERPHPYVGARWNDQYINLTCRVECSPLCNISWTKNGREIDLSVGGRYSIVERRVEAIPTANIFESKRSTLVWNMDAWPDSHLDRISDNANYSCHSSSNLVGPGVNSTTAFGVEYPPENVTVTNTMVNVTENNIPPRVLCSAKAFPEASYNWSRQGESEVINKGNALILNWPMNRLKGGNYTCTAYNKHGATNQTTFFNVQFKPECGITQTEQDGKIMLVCTATANPQNVEFEWYVKNENGTINENVKTVGLQSYLILDTSVENFRTYLCYAKNLVGKSFPCERDVTGYISWWSRFENDSLMLLLAAIAGTILMVIIICIIIIIVCRRKRAADKCPNNSATKDKSDLNSSPSDALLQTDPDNKAFYENLPFHGMQNAPNKPFRPEYTDLDYADVDYRSYGPINYKAASIFAAQQKNAPPDDDEELL